MREKLGGGVVTYHLRRCNSLRLFSPLEGPLEQEISRARMHFLGALAPCGQRLVGPSPPHARIRKNPQANPPGKRFPEKRQPKYPHQEAHTRKQRRAFVTQVPRTVRQGLCWHGGVVGPAPSAPRAGVVRGGAFSSAPGLFFLWDPRGASLASQLVSPYFRRIPG